MTFAALGDSAVMVTLGPGLDKATLARVRTLAQALERAHLPGIVDIVPAYATVAVFYEPARLGPGDGSPYDRVCAAVARHAGSESRGAERFRRLSFPERHVEIPVCYGGDFGPDLGAVAGHAGLGPDEVAAQHSAPDYWVHAIGFAPGFPYLGGLPERLHTPRRSTPRDCVPAGSVGIGGAQTGVYPLASPGGWQLIGRTPLRLFRPGDPEPALVRVGDRVTFRPITPEEFDSWK